MKSSVQVPQDTSPTILCAQRFDADGPFTLYRGIGKFVVCGPCGCLNSPNKPTPFVVLPNLYYLNFCDSGMLRLVGKSVKGSSTSTADPMPSPFWAAGFNFASSDVIKEVPYDESLRHLFFGEETTMAVRMWTHGWDFFAPPETVCYHL